MVEVTLITGCIQNKCSFLEETFSVLISPSMFQKILLRVDCTCFMAHMHPNNVKTFDWLKIWCDICMMHFICSLCPSIFA